MPETPDLSIVVPVKDEEANVLPMLEEIRAVAARWPERWELVFVDDGSSDATWERIRAARAAEPRVRAVRFARKCGQTTAVLAGVRHARGRLCATLDGDCQNDPADIPKLLAMMDRYDLVIGWRRSRSDSSWRRFQSWFANTFRNFMTGETVHDIGCALKVFDRRMMLETPLFEGMHRFMPTLFRLQGWRVAEAEVNHRPRSRGATKYGMWNRVFRSLRDLFAVRWMARRMIRYRLRDEDTID